MLLEKTNYIIRKGDFMKNFKKLLAAGLTTITAMSAISVPAMAKQVVKYDSGVVMTIYETKEEFDRIMPRTVDMTFSTTLTTSLKYLKSLETSSEIMTLSGNETEIVVQFDKQPNSLYCTLYDVSSNKVLIDDKTASQYGYAVTYSSLPKQHKFKLGYRTSSGTLKVSGRVDSH